MGKKEDKGSGENIKVAVRVRPLFSKEIERGDKECVDCDIAASQVIVRGEAGAPYMWTFDYVFNKTFAQKDIFLQVVHPMIEAMMDGFNATIFAYGIRPPTLYSLALGNCAVCTRIHHISVQVRVVQVRLTQ